MAIFEDIYQGNYRKIFCVAYKIIGDEDVVRDIVQEIFVSYYEKNQNGTEIFHPQNWLFKSAVNKSIDYVKRNRKHVGLDDLEQFESENDEQFDMRQREMVLRKALEKLKANEIKLAVLYSEGFSYREIAELSGVNFTSVGKMLSRTLLKLKKILKQMNYDEMYR